MDINKTLGWLLTIGFLTFTTNAQAVTDNPDDLSVQFVERMVSKHGFDRKTVSQLLTQSRLQRSILKAMSSPAEGKDWYQYRPIFLTQSRIRKGVSFWRTHEAVLAATAKKYGVPAEIIIAIIGVETFYGGNTGKYRVLDALTTLGFHYPKRGKFFRSELEQFLLLCREESMNPLKPKGSYAGAMGLPQFISSSYRNFAADFEGDNKRDIWKNPADAIASVANYFVEHRWKTGQAVAYPVSVQGHQFKKILSKNLKPGHSLTELQALGVQVPTTLNSNTQAKLLEFKLKKGSEYWLGLDNFYVITRYNHSPMYAMAVYQLSQAIRKHSQQPDLAVTP